MASIIYCITALVSTHALDAISRHLVAVFVVWFIGLLPPLQLIMHIVAIVTFGAQSRRKMCGVYFAIYGLGSVGVDPGRFGSFFKPCVT